jgi:molecular chaperone GrpE
MTGGWQPGRGGGEPPQVQHDFGSETAPPETGPPGTGPADGGGDAGGPGSIAVVADLEARLAEAEDQKLRAVADLANLRRRCAAQVDRAEADARTQVARQWLPVVDNLERALEHATADPRTIPAFLPAPSCRSCGPVTGHQTASCGPRRS